VLCCRLWHSRNVVGGPAVRQPAACDHVTGVDVGVEVEPPVRKPGSDIRNDETWGEPDRHMYGNGAGGRARARRRVVNPQIIERTAADSIRGRDDREAWAIRRRRHVLHREQVGLFSLTKISTGGWQTSRGGIRFQRQTGFGELDLRSSPRSGNRDLDIRNDERGASRVDDMYGNGAGGRARADAV